MSECECIQISVSEETVQVGITEETIQATLGNTPVSSDVEYIYSYTPSTTPQKKTELEITQAIPEGTNFNIVSGGIGYVKSGDDGNIKTSELLYFDTLSVQIEKNGVRLDKSDDTVWVNSQTFQLNKPVDSGDKLIIFS